MDTDIERIQTPDGQIYRRAAMKPGPDGYFKEMGPLAPYEETGDVFIAWLPEGRFGVESPGVPIHQVK